VFLWWRGKDSNLRRPKSTGLQPAPFDRFGTPPWNYKNSTNSIYALFKQENIMTKTFWIGGKNTVIEAIKNPQRKIKRVAISKNFEEFNTLNFKSIKIEKVEINFFNKIFKDKNFVHQGIGAEVEPLKSEDIKNDISNLKNLIVLDNITDPRNLGSILRTALAFGLDGVIVQKKNFKSSSPMMNKSASGAIEKLKIYQVSNIGNIIRLLKKNSFWIYGMSSNTDKLFSQLKTFDEKNVFIFGSEGKGISLNNQTLCDDIFKIKISEKIDSLNVSNAVSATLALFSFQRQAF